MRQSRLHDPMPVVLSPQDFASWLDVQGTAPEAAVKLLLPAAADLLDKVELDPKINDSKRDEPGVQETLQKELLL